MELILVLLLVAAAIGAVVVTSNRSKAKAAALAEAEMAPVRTLVEEDITALGVELQDLDIEMAGQALDAGANADYQRALDAYESAKVAVTQLTAPEQVKNVTEILEDGRYAMACVRARVEGKALPARRSPCFFDPRHGMSVADVTWTPPGGAEREVPACALDVERVRAGAEPDVRKVMVGSQRVPYWQGGKAYQPYAAGYYGGFGPMQWMFMGMLFSGGLNGLGEAIGGIGEGLGEAVGGIGEGLGDVFGGIGDGIGDIFDGFDF